jgi:hypothetical protein
MCCDNTVVNYFYSFLIHKSKKCRLDLAGSGLNFMADFCISDVITSVSANTSCVAVHSHRAAHLKLVTLMLFEQCH